MSDWFVHDSSSNRGSKGVSKHPAKTLAIVPIALLLLAASRPFTGLSPGGLGRYDYNEMTLLKVLPAKDHAGAACFFASHNYAAGGIYVWLHLKEVVGIRNGELVRIFRDGVEIVDMEPVNGTDWIERPFSWPLAKGKEAQKLAPGCGDKPNR